jgi:hypothetical protein
MKRRPPEKSSTGKPGVPRPDARAAFLEFEARGHQDEDGNVRTQQWFAEKWGVSEESLCAWKKSEGWEDRVEELHLRIMIGMDRKIWARVGKSIQTAGDATLFSKRFGRMIEPEEATGSITQNFHIQGPALVEQQREFFRSSTGASSADEVFRDGGPAKGKPRTRRQAK